MPSGTPVLQQVIDNLVTSMQGITGEPDYYTTVPLANVFLCRNADMLSNPNKVPCIYVIPLGSPVDPPNPRVPYRINQLFSFGLSGVLRLYTNVRSETIHEQIARFATDVHKAFALDPQRGATCIDSRISSYELIYPDDETDGIGGADLGFDCWFRTLRTDLNTPR